MAKEGEESYFVVPRTALHILILLRENFKQRYTALDLRVSLGKLTRRRGEKRSLLQRNEDNARYTYSENYDIEQSDDDDRLVSLFGISLATISALTLYTIADLNKKILGFLGLDGRRVVTIHVLPEYRRKRLGTRLVDFAVTLDKTDLLVVEVPVGSVILPFFEACGFKEHAEDKKQWGKIV